MRILTPGSNWHREKGVTLIELIIVLVLLGLAAGVVAPSFSRGLRGIELETAGRDLITRMKQARSRAISRQQVFRVILVREEESADYYVLANEFEQVIDEFSLPEGVSVEVPDQEFQAPFLKVSFYPNGRSSGASFILYNETKTIAVWVDPITGFARVVKEPADR